MRTIDIHRDAAALFKLDVDLTRMEIADITGVSEDDQNSFFFETAYAWLQEITDNDGQALEHLPRTAEFWGFWKKTWQKADIAFIRLVREYGLGSDGEYPLSEFYRFFHRVTRDNPHVNNNTVHADYHLLMKLLSNKRFEL